MVVGKAPVLDDAGRDVGEEDVRPGDYLAAILALLRVQVEVSYLPALKLLK